jgi:hypothetical protein
MTASPRRRAGMSTKVGSSGSVLTSAFDPLRTLARCPKYARSLLVLAMIDALRVFHEVWQPQSMRMVLLVGALLVASPAASLPQSKVLRGTERGCSSVLNARACFRSPGEPELYLLGRRSKLLDDMDVDAGNPLKIDGRRDQVTVTLGNSNNWKYPFDRSHSVTFWLKRGRAVRAQFVDVDKLECGDFNSVRTTVLDVRTGQFEIKLIEGSKRRFHGRVRRDGGSFWNLRFVDLFNLETMTDERLCKLAGF